MFGELKLMYPEIFGTEAMAHNTATKKYLLSKLDEIIEDKSDTLDVDLKRLVHYMKITPFHGKDNEEIKYERSFDDLCVMMAQNTNRDIKIMTTREFYALYAWLKNKSIQDELRLQKSRQRGGRKR